MFVDSHCHLNYSGLVEQLPSVVQRANDAGVSHMVCICSRISEFSEITKITESYENIFCSVGVHPHECEKEGSVEAETLIELAEHPKVVGIGETGLDFFYNHTSKEIQIRNFRKHIQAARETGLPIIIHTRNADQETIKILNEEAEEGGVFPGLIHCFSTHIDVAMCALELGLYISISGIITFKNAHDLRESILQIPLERLLIETDSPFLAPVPHRGKTNEPALIIHTAEEVSKLFDVPVSQIAEITKDNFFSLFLKAVPQI